MAIILGEHDSNGKYSWFGGEDIIPDEPELEEVFSESPVDAHPFSRSTSASQALNTLEDDEQDNNNEEDEVMQLESTGKRRHQESEQLGTNMSKKPKVSGANAIDKIGDGINNLAEVLAKKYTYKESSQQVIVHQQTLADATVGSTVQGLAAKKIQEEACLTLEGQLFMLELLDKEALARTYMALEADKLRALWLKKQLQQHGEDLAQLFIDL
jgi:hypothetical protein